MAEVASLAKILGRMSDIEHQDVKKDFFGLIYGGYGTGKTTLVAGIAQALKGDGRILFLDSSQGAAALDNMPKLKADIDWLPVRDPRELMVIANALKARKKVGNYDFSDYTVVLLDELDSWFEIILHNYVREVTGTLPTQDLPEIEGKMYAAPTAATLNIINTLSSVENLHIIVTAHDQERGKEPRVMVSPSLPPKLMKGVNEKVHLVARLEAIISKDGYVRELQVNPSKQVVAKSRIGGLDVKVPFNKLPTIIKKWVGSERMVEDVTAKHTDPDLVEDEDVETVEVENLDEDEAIEVE